MNKNIKELMEDVVGNDYCIGCGVCASLTNTPLKMQLDEYGKYKPYLSNVSEDEMEINPLSICPFSNNSKNETEIGEEIFSHYPETRFNKYTGYYIQNYAGYVKEGEFRKKGSSGGMGNWIASQLLDNDLVDGIIHVKSSNNNSNDTLFEYNISYHQEDLSSGAKSKYYPIELSQVIKFVRENKGRYALIGIPCYLKSVRLLANQDKIVKDSIKYFVGLVCGHLKSDMFAKSIGWQLGIEPEKLNSIDFRKKTLESSANRYSVEVKGERNGEELTLSSPTKELYTTNWGHGLFKYNACEFCDDVLAETADVTVGDAWLPEYIKDGMGTNIITVRNPDIQEIFERNKEKVHLDKITAEKIYQSQAGGFRHRRDGLSYRLHLKDIKNEWRPLKRVEPSDELSLKRKKIYEQRTSLSQASFTAFKLAEQKGDFNEFTKYMTPLINDYNRLIAPPFFVGLIKKVKSQVKKVIKK